MKTKIESGAMELLSQANETMLLESCKIATRVNIKRLYVTVKVCFLVICVLVHVTNSSLQYTPFWYVLVKTDLQMSANLDQTSTQLGGLS